MDVATHLFIALWYRAWQVACPETTSNGHWFH